MTKKALIIVILASFTISVIIMGSFYIFLNKSSNRTQKQSISTTYILKQYNNTLAIFKEGEKDPYKILDVPFNNLPFADKELLVKGIYSKNLGEIMKYAEDYDG